MSFSHLVSDFFAACVTEVFLKFDIRTGEISDQLKSGISSGFYQFLLTMLNQNKNKLEFSKLSFLDFQMVFASCEVVLLINSPQSVFF